SFNTSASDLHYRYPVIYAEMLQIISMLEKKKLSKNMLSVICYAIQIEGSADRTKKDNKFITARYIAKDNPTEMVTIFLGVVSPDNYRAKGLLTAITIILKQFSISIENLVMVTTDGEAANTGKNSG
ncbi:Hypothetical protein CINCED_3A023920, partial [Cinara cedri]